ncbi:MAG: ribosome-associated translation inhibitor RaiA [Clostridia bacterium]|nr:ribosome-associated translation inhibitor RaiA [Clostridia bacterium]
MKITITGRKMELTESMKQAAEKKISKLSKFFSDDAEATVTFSIEKDRHTVEATIYYNGMIYRAQETNADMYAALDRVVDVIERQIRKNKTRLEKRLRANAFDKSADFVGASVEEEKEFNIVKTKRYALKPMSAEEAILQMNLLGHEFYLFKNAETNDNNLVYKRKNGDYGLIEIE